MSKSHEVTVDGSSFTARRGELLLDAALRNGVELPHDCRSGHCGTCCVRLVAGEVDGGKNAEPGIVHACQSRITGDVVVAKRSSLRTRTVKGQLMALRPLSREVTEAEIRLDNIFPHHPGQYAQLQFSGFPSRPFSITQPLLAVPAVGTVCFQIRRMTRGRVTHNLGKQIRPGHSVELSGPFGSAHFRSNGSGRIVLVGTSTGFAPIWSIAIAALRENPARAIMIIAGGRGTGSLYMLPALSRLARFPNVSVLPVCSGQIVDQPYVQRGRPTDFIPRLLPTDEVYVCGAPAMVESVRGIVTQYGATCYADPFQPAHDIVPEAGLFGRAKIWLADSALGKREARNPEPHARTSPARPQGQRAMTPGDRSWSQRA